MARLLHPSLSATPNATNNGDRKGLHWGSVPSTGSGWHDATSATYPDWLQIDFNGSKTIDEIDVVTVQDDYLNPVEPTESMTFGTYGITGFDVQYWNGSAWTTITGGSVTGNNKVWRKFNFTAVNTTKIRVQVNSSLAGYSRIVELEAWGTVGGGAAEVNWLVADQLGTPRMVIDKTGALANVKRHDYLPFGEELVAPQGLRTTGLGYTGDAVRQKFTSYERDGETQLDYAQARYYSSQQGRFTSVDPLQSSASTGNPQTFNRYTYALNSPANLTDPSGMLSMNATSAMGQFARNDESVTGAHGSGGVFSAALASGQSWSLFRWDVEVGPYCVNCTAEPQNSQADNTIAVTAASIEPFGIQGRISGENKDLVGFSVLPSTGIFEEGAKFDVTLTLRLPKNTTDLAETLPVEIPGGKGERPGGERNVMVHGSSVDNGGTNNNFQFATRYENSIMGKGKVSFSGVDYRAGIATARFSLSTKMYDPRSSNTVSVNLAGQTKRHFINTTIKVKIAPRPF